MAKETQSLATEAAFTQWWAERVAEGYQYGAGPLATVKFGFEAGFQAAAAQLTPTIVLEPDRSESKAQSRLVLKRLFDTERRLPNRNFAKDHSFEEWLER